MVVHMRPTSSKTQKCECERGGKYIPGKQHKEIKGQLQPPNRFSSQKALWVIQSVITNEDEITRVTKEF